MEQEERKERNFDSRLEVSYDSSLKSIWDYEKNLKEFMGMREKSVVKGNPIGRVKISLDELPKTKGEFISLYHDTVKEKHSKPFEEVFATIFGSGKIPNCLSPYEFFHNQTRLDFIADNPDFEYDYYGGEHGYFVLSFFGKFFVLPNSTATSITYNEDKLLLESSAEGEEAMLPILANKERKELALTELKALEDQAFDIENFYTPELKAQYEQIEAQKRELEKQISEMYTLQSKMRAEMELKIAEMKKSMFLMETDFYSILCRWGETVSFTRISSGKKAPVDQPLAIQQKTIYLAEDLPRLAHLCNEKANNLEELIQTSPKFLDYITLNNKSITFVKNQKVDGSYQSTDNRIIKFVHELYPTSVGILIRDGENVYLGWADASKIQVGEDSFVSNSSKGRAFESMDDLMKDILVVSRYYITNLIIGLVNGPKSLIQLPTSVNTPQEVLNNPYIVFANVDHQIVTNRYPSLSEYRDMVNEFTNADNKVYILTELRDGTQRGWNNNPIYTRGKGEHVLTRDAIVQKGITSIRSVDYDTEVNKSFWVGSDRSRYSWKEEKISPSFKIEPEEFVNINYMTAEMVDEWISNKNIGNLYVDRTKLSFEFMVKTLIELRDLVHKTQKEEQLVIPSTYYNSDLVASFKVVKGVVNMTAYQGKRFVKWVESLNSQEKDYYSNYTNVLKNMDKELALSMRERYIVGFEHPEGPVFYGLDRELKTVKRSRYRKPEQVEKLHYSRFYSPRKGWYSDYTPEITTFGHKKKAQELAERLNKLSRDKYQGEEWADGVEVKYQGYGDHIHLPESFTWKVYTLSEYKEKIEELALLADKLQKEDEELYKYWV